MHNPFDLPIVISIKKSRWLSLWLCFIHIGVIPVQALSDLPVFIQISIIPVVLISLYKNLCHFVLMNRPQSVVRMFLNHRDEWWITTADMHIFRVRLMPTALVHPILTVLCFSSARGKYPVILIKDAVNSPDEFRRLRVRLKYPR